MATETLRPRVEIIGKAPYRFNLRYACGHTADNIGIGYTGGDPKSPQDDLDRRMESAFQCAERPCVTCRYRELDEYAAAAEQKLAAALPLSALRPWYLVKGE